MERPARPLPTMATLSLGAPGAGGGFSGGNRERRGASLGPTSEFKGDCPGLATRGGAATTATTVVVGCMAPRIAHETCAPGTAMLRLLNLRAPNARLAAIEGHAAARSVLPLQLAIPRLTGVWATVRSIIKRDVLPPVS